MLRLCTKEKMVKQVVSTWEGICILSLTHLEGCIRLAFKSNIRKDISNAADGTNNRICFINKCPSKAS